MREIEPSALDKNVFQLVGEDWMLVTAGGPDKLNTMTASWGGLGVIWGEPAATVYLRPQRYTKEFVDAHDTFTLSFFDEGWRKQLAYLGSVSGRDEDKVAKAGLTPAFDQAGRTSKRRRSCSCAARRTSRPSKSPASSTARSSTGGTPNATCTRCTSASWKRCW